MVGVFVLHPKMSGSSDNLNKTRMVHVILSITDTWRGVDNPILETPIFIQQKKKKKVCNHWYIGYRVRVKTL